MASRSQKAFASTMAALCLVIGTTPALSQSRLRADTTAADLSSSFEAAARRVSPAVVEIFATSYRPASGLVPSSADLVRRERASGSGVIIDPDGYIVTNAHVVAGGQRLRVNIPAASGGQSIVSSRGRTVTGQIVGIDIETDLAVIKVDERNLPTATIANSDELKPGQMVLAIGSPLGLNNSVSLGLVSAVGRQLEPESPMVYVQTDASINAGSSGGPLIDLQGRVVGINTLIFSQGGGNDGLGFAAPSNIVRTVYDQIRKNGYVQRGDIGLRAQTVTPALASGLGLARDHGVIVGDVLPGSPAEREGLQPGDLVLTLDGKAMENGRQLHVNLYRRFMGDVVTLEILRDGQMLTLKVPVAERHDPLQRLSALIDPRQNLVPRLGILGVDLDAEIAAMVPALRTRSGVVVVSTVADALDSRDGGLATGDVVYAVNRKPVAGLSELRAALEALRAGESVVLHLERRGELMYLAFTVE